MRKKTLVCIALLLCVSALMCLLGYHIGYERGDSHASLILNSRIVRLAIQELMDARARGVTNEAIFSRMEVYLQTALVELSSEDMETIRCNIDCVDNLALAMKYRDLYPFTHNAIGFPTHPYHFSSNELARTANMLRGIHYSDQPHIDFLFSEEGKNTWLLGEW